MTRAATGAAASMLTSVLTAGHAQADTNLATFDFENTAGRTSANITGNTLPALVADTGVFNTSSYFTGFHANASTVFSNTSPYGLNSSTANGASANFWSTGDYWQFNTSSTSYNLTTIAFGVNGSNTGPRDFELEYSLSNSSNASYVNIAGYNVTLAAQNFSFNVSAITALDNQANVYFRLVNYDTVNVINNGTAVASGGTDRIDNVVVSGLLPGAASGSLTFDPAATAGGTAGRLFTTDASVKNFIDSGTNADVAYVDGNTVTFTDAGVGAVTVVATGVAPAATSVTNTTGTYTFTGGAIGGTGSLTKTGAGILILGSTNTYSGGTIIAGGTVQVSADADLGTGAINLNGGTLQTTAGFTSAKALNFNAASTIDTQGNALSFSAVPSGTAALTKLGTGSLTLAPYNSAIGSLNISAGSVTLDNAKVTSYVNFGSTGVASTITGTLNVGTTAANTFEIEPIASATIGGTGSIQFAPGSSIDQYATGTSTVATTIGVTSAGGVNPFFGAGTGVVANGAGRILNITGSIVDGTAGAGGVIFGGPSGTALPLTGTVVLGGANTYSLGTTITAGTVVANSSSGTSALGTGTVVVTEYTSGTTTPAGILAGNGYVTAPVVLAAGSKITAGSGSTANDSIGSLHTGAQTWNSSAGYMAKVNGTTNATDLLTMSGLTVQAVAGTPFVVTLQNVSGGSTVLPAGTQYVLAVDTNLSQLNVFSNAIGTSLTLVSTGFTVSNSAALTLAEVDTSGGEELVLNAGTVSTPEPTSLLLTGLAAVPLILGRKRRVGTAAQA